MKWAGHRPIITAEFPKKMMAAAIGPISTAAQKKIKKQSEDHFRFHPFHTIWGLNNSCLLQNNSHRAKYYYNKNNQQQNCRCECVFFFFTWNLPLMEPRRRSKRKNGRKETKLQSLERKPTGTCILERQGPVQNSLAVQAAGQELEAHSPSWLVSRSS